MTIQWLTTGIVLVLGAIAALIDWRDQKLPRKWTDPMVAVAFGGASAAALNGGEFEPLLWAVLGACALGVLPIVFLIVGVGGFADIPFAIALGASIGWLGPATLLTAIGVGALLTWSLTLVTDGKTLPAGPGHLLGAVAGLAVGLLL